MSPEYGILAADSGSSVGSKKSFLREDSSSFGLGEEQDFSDRDFDDISRLSPNYDEDDDEENEDAAAVAPGSPCTQNTRNTASFWLLGLLNNNSYVIMMAGAKQVSSGGVGLVFLADIVPGFAVKLSSPLWFHLIPYSHRVVAASFLMSMSFCLVGLSDTLFWQLMGVVCCSFQAGMGEASSIALASTYDPLKDLTAWSSGTGFAGVFGYAWVYVLHLALGWSFKATLLAANIFPVLWLLVFFRLLGRPQRRRGQQGGGGANDLAKGVGAGAREEDRRGGGVGTEREMEGPSPLHSRGRTRDEKAKKEKEKKRRRPPRGKGVSPTSSLLEREQRCCPFVARWREGGGGRRSDYVEMVESAEEVGREYCNTPAVVAVAGGGGGGSGGGSRGGLSDTEERGGDAWASTTDPSSGKEDLSGLRAKGRFVASLWPFIVPLVLVYAAEYTIQTGVWSAVGFPVTSSDARDRFYAQANWIYQAGVFTSRSSGMLIRANMPALWAMPILQTGILAVYYTASVTHFWYDKGGFLGLAFVTGLLGGAVYVNAFTGLAHRVAPDRKEIALSFASIGDSLGIMISDSFGLFVQACVYKANGISGALVGCPWRA